eukprot:jgi/Botrbrau1/10243/Bobra.0140s0001.1
MKLTILYGDETFMMEVGQGDSLTQVMTTLEGLTGLTSARQILIANSQKLDPRLTVSGSGLQDGDLVVVEQSTAPHVPAASAREGWTAEAQLADLFERCRSNPQLLQRAPRSIHDAVQSNNFNAFVEHVRQWKAEEEMQKADPFDPEAQARIAEYIRSKNVEENMQIAFDECPEAFSDVIMLYVNLEVNNHAIKAFVDSGAQRTIMSHECAGRCNILHLLDTRFAGIARGVGQGKILGRVHAVQMKVGDRYLPVSITVLESNDVDFLFGLDMLRRYQCSIDLLSNVLRFPSINLELPFLSEHELPTHARLFLPGEEASASAGANPGHFLFQHVVPSDGVKCLVYSSACVWKSIRCTALLLCNSFLHSGYSEPLNASNFPATAPFRLMYISTVTALFPSNSYMITWLLTKISRVLRTGCKCFGSLQHLSLPVSPFPCLQSCMCEAVIFY